MILVSQGSVAWFHNKTDVNVAIKMNYYEACVRTARLDI